MKKGFNTLSTGKATSKQNPQIKRLPSAKTILQMLKGLTTMLVLFCSTTTNAQVAFTTTSVHTPTDAETIVLDFPSGTPVKVVQTKSSRVIVEKTVKLSTGNEAYRVLAKSARYNTTQIENKQTKVLTLSYEAPTTIITNTKKEQIKESISFVVYVPKGSQVTTL